MEEMDAFAASLFEEAKGFLEKARSSSDPVARTAFAHAALLLGISALEAHVNAVADEMGLRIDLTVLDRSILEERDFGLEKGRFDVTNKLKMYRLEDRLLFLFARFGKKSEPTSAPWWARLKDGVSARNN